MNKASIIRVRRDATKSGINPTRHFKFIRKLRKICGEYGWGTNPESQYPD